MSEIDGVDYHWGPHPEWEYLTKHVGTRKECSGPDCGVDEWVVKPCCPNESRKFDGGCRNCGDPCL